MGEYNVTERLINVYVHFDDSENAYLCGIVPVSQEAEVVHELLKHYHSVTSEGVRYYHDGWRYL